MSKSDQDQMQAYLQKSKELDTLHEHYLQVETYIIKYDEIIADLATEDSDRVRSIREENAEELKEIKKKIADLAAEKEALEDKFK